MLVAIDPGHGMSNKKWGVYDPGAVHKENGVIYKEADIVLQYGLTLRNVLQSRNIGVFMTRDDVNDHAPVQQRAKNAKNAGCKIFISLHMNDSEMEVAEGVEVLYRDDKNFALALQKAVVKNDIKSRPYPVVQRNDLAVLKFNGLAALIELGFIYNDADRTILLNPQKRLAICNSIADVVQAEIEKQSITPLTKTSSINNVDKVTENV
jgi:N-acetylmuramoyl-L-alanine amidase